MQNNNFEHHHPEKTNQFYDTEALQVEGQKMLALISELYEKQATMDVQPRVEPGFLRAQFEGTPPEKGCEFDLILQDTRDKIFPGLKHWQHPGFFGYLPSGSSHPTVVADMFASAFHSPAFIWHASPAMTELENLVVDWLAQLFHLPECYQLRSTGGGTIAGSISEGLFSTCHAAKRRKMNELGIELGDARTLQFVGYYTQHSFSTSEKALLVKDIAHRRIIPVHYSSKTHNYQCDVAKFEEMLVQDTQAGLIPFWLNSMLGTTSTCAYDDTAALNALCKKYGIWHNVDAAYAGVTWTLQKNRDKVDTLESIDSLLINAAKFLMVGNTGALLYVRDKIQFQCSFLTGQTQFEVIKNKYSEEIGTITDYCNWSVGFGRRFNALKLFYVIRAFGREGIAKHLTDKEQLADYFVQLIYKSKGTRTPFRLFTAPDLTVVCFRLYRPEQETQSDQTSSSEEGQGQQKNDKDSQSLLIIGADEKNREAYNALNKRLKVRLDEDTTKGLITPSEVAGDYFLRFVIANPNTTTATIDRFWEYMCEKAAAVLAEK